MWEDISLLLNGGFYSHFSHLGTAGSWKRNRRAVIPEVNACRLSGLRRIHNRSFHVRDGFLLLAHFGHSAVIIQLQHVDKLWWVNTVCMILIILILTIWCSESVKILLRSMTSRLGLYKWTRTSTCNKDITRPQEEEEDKGREDGQQQELQRQRWGWWTEETHSSSALCCCASSPRWGAS